MVRKSYFLFFIVFCTVAATLDAQNVKFSFDLENVTLATVFREIERNSDYSFVFRSNEVDAEERVSVRVKEQTMDAVLERVLKTQGLSYVVNGRHVTVYKPAPDVGGSSAARPTDGTVTGTVSDETGVLSGVTITVKGTNIGVLTGGDGRYSVNVPGGDVTLVFSLMGFATREVAVGGRAVIDVTLKEDVEEIEEVVVVGYGTQKKSHLSGAVSTISAKALENRPVGNANLALQGLAPNVNIAAGNGNPLQAPSINVRGYTSINGGEALILVDNVPVSAAEFSRLSPADIANISVLKDAASAAIYGARAAFGVVLVTTKTARSDKLEVNANVNYSLHRNLNVFKYDMDLVNFMEVINLVSGDDEYTAAQIDYARRRMADPSLPEVRVPGNLTDPPLHWDEYDYYGMTDWWKEITDDAASALTANISLGERGERLTYHLSGEFYRRGGMFLGEKPLYRYNFRGTGSYRLAKWWTVGSTVSYSRLNNDAPYIIGGSDKGAPANMSGQYIKNPVRNPDGTYTESGSNVVGQLLDGGRHQLDEDMIQLSFNTKIDILKDVLALKGDVNIRRRRETAKWWQLRIPHARVPGNIQYRNNPDRAGNSSATVDYSVANFYADFNKTFADKHSVTALAGFNQEHTADYRFDARRENLITDRLPETSLATGAMTGEQRVRELSIRGAFGRVNYTFDNRYIVEFNGRYDGSSRYVKGKRFGFFPSGTGAWILSNEGFFASVKDALPVSFLKFRGSYGVLGNQLTGDNWYPYFSNMNAPAVNDNVYLDGVRPVVIKRPSSEAANNLTWERVRTVNLGVNLSMFDNRLSVDFDNYTRYTEGMLAPSMPMPAQFGANVASTNAADLKTKGWELDLSWRDEIKAGGSPLSYSVRIMLSDARSKITKYHNPTRTFSAKWREGQEVGEIWGYEVPGLFQSAEEVAGWYDQTPIKHPRRETWEAGDMKFNNLNGDNVINAGDNTENNPGDRRVIGNSTARLPYAIDLSAGWKGFDLRVFFQGVGKRDWYPDYNEFWSSYQDSWRTPSLYIRDRWTPENPGGYYPRLFNRAAHYGGAYEWGPANTRYLQDASYLRLKNLTVGYTLPKNLTDGWGVANLRVYFSGENLWTLSRLKVDALDPETVGMDNYSTYPMQAVYSLGVNLAF